MTDHDRPERDPTARALMLVSVVLLLVVLAFLASRVVHFVRGAASPGTAPVASAAAPSPARAAAPPPAPAADGADAPLPSGKHIVDSVCISCHGSGVLGAPKIGDHRQWVPRVGQGFDVLLKHTAEGFRSMPARGGDPSLSDADLKRALAYMLDQAGFEAPAGWETAGAAAPATP